MGRAVACESKLEHDHCVLLDVRRDVTGLYPQPEVITFLGPDGKRHDYTPDLLVTFEDGREEVHEVKPDDRATWPQAEAYYAAAKHAYSLLGRDFCVVLESDIRREPRLANALLLRSARSRSLTREEVRRTEDVLGDKTMPLGRLVRAFGGDGHASVTVRAMLLCGLLDGDWATRPVNDDLPVSLARTDR